MDEKEPAQQNNEAGSVFKRGKGESFLSFYGPIFLGIVVCEIIINVVKALIFG